MDPIQQYIAMAFGAAVAASGVALMLRGDRDSGRNAIEIWGQKIEISRPALVVFLVGSAIFVVPFFLEPPRWSRTLWPGPKVGGPENTGPEPRKQQGFQTNTPGVVAEVTDFSMTGALANLSFRFSGAGEQPAILCIEPQKSTLIDEQTGEEWKPVSFSDPVNCNAYPKGISTVIWMRFPIEAALQTTFTAHVPGIAEPIKGLSLK